MNSQDITPGHSIPNPSELGLICGHSHTKRMLLRQICYWYGLDKNGRSRLRVQRDGHYWIAKSTEEWGRELGGVPAETIRAYMRDLEKKGIICRDTGGFAGKRRILFVRLQNRSYWKIKSGKTMGSQDRETQRLLRLNPVNQKPKAVNLAKESRISAVKSGKSSRSLKYKSTKSTSTVLPNKVLPDLTELEIMQYAVPLGFLVNDLGKAKSKAPVKPSADTKNPVESDEKGLEAQERAESEKVPNFEEVNDDAQTHTEDHPPSELLPVLRKVRSDLTGLNALTDETKAVIRNAKCQIVGKQLTLFGDFEESDRTVRYIRSILPMYEIRVA